MDSKVGDANNMIRSANLPLALFALSASIITFFVARIWIRQVRRKQKYQLLEGIEAAAQIRTEIQGPDTDQLLLSTPGKILNTSYGAWLRSTAGRAGIWESSDLEKLVVKKFRLAIGVFIITALSIQLWGLPLILLLIAPVFIFFFQDLILLDRAKSRLKEIERELPDTIDLLNMCVSAGIGFHAGMQRVAMTEDNPLSQEFSRVLAEMKLGLSRGQALTTMSERLGIGSLNQFVNSILQVDRLGVPMAKVLEEQSRRLRAVRREKAREQAQKLPVKILAPTMLFMLPALLIIVIGPAVISIIRSL